MPWQKGAAKAKSHKDVVFDKDWFQTEKDSNQKRMIDEEGSSKNGILCSVPQHVLVIKALVQEQVHASSVKILFLNPGKIKLKLIFKWLCIINMEQYSPNIV